MAKDDEWHVLAVEGFGMQIQSRLWCFVGFQFEVQPACVLHTLFDGCH